MTDARHRQPELLTLHDLMDGGRHFRIPIYQRNFAWQAREVEQLLIDVAEAARAAPGAPYYIGTLVTARETDAGGHETLHVVDGQQRLTTLNILMAWLWRHGLVVGGRPLGTGNIAFEHRPESDASLRALFDRQSGRVAPDPPTAPPTPTWCAFAQADQTIDAFFAPWTARTSEIKEFARALFGTVRVLVVELPPKTDLNRYFEIMNSRGEQLAQHEILKVRLMERLNGTSTHEQACFARVWDACANMEVPIETGDPALMPFWESADFAGLCDSLATTGAQGQTAPDTLPTTEIFSLWDLAHGSTTEHPDGAAQPRTRPGVGIPGRAATETVTGFPFFLLHTLRVHCRLHPSASFESSTVSLDDKRLLDAFARSGLPGPRNAAAPFAERQAEAAHVGQFAGELLRCRVLFDRFVIRRQDQEEEPWNLALPKPGDRSHEELRDQPTRQAIVMLQAAFHYSYTAPSGRHWLSAVLAWLAGRARATTTIELPALLAELERLAARLTRYYVAPSATGDAAEDLALVLLGDLEPAARPSAHDMAQQMTYDRVRNFVFNHLDYLLWRQERGEPDARPAGGTGRDARILRFRFTSRSSKEHFQPQNPLAGDDAWTATALHSFGNLCLVSAGHNSHLNNHSASSKAASLLKDGEPLQSIKQYRMAQQIDAAGEWTPEMGSRHQAEMIGVLERALAAPGSMPGSP